jgi:hypothetical protein
MAARRHGYHGDIPSQLLARIAAPVLATMPLAVHPVGASEANGDPAALDGPAIQRPGRAGQPPNS